MNETIYIVTESVKTVSTNGSSTTKRMLNATEISGEQALLNSQNNGTMASRVVDGEVELCKPGCKDCECTSCKNRFVFDRTSETCKRCAPGCKSCSWKDTAVCLTCVKGAFLNSTQQCEKCDSGCVRCEGNATNCTKCRPGRFFNGTACVKCEKGCYDCLTTTTCQKCRKGFVLKTDGSCGRCMSTCSQCDVDDRRVCTSCSKGLELVDGKCQDCP